VRQQSVVAILELILLVCIVVAIIGLSDLGQSQNQWAFASALLIGVTSFALLLKIAKRKPGNRDKVPDFLGNIPETCFGQRGLCFRPAISVRNGLASLDISFQNSYERPVSVRINARPTVNFFLRRHKSLRTSVRFECGPAAYGIVCVPLPILARYQGALQKFDFSCSVKFPCGRGKRLRFQHGLPTGTRGGGFLRLFAALAGILVTTRPACAEFRLPQNVAETLAEGMAIEIFEKWKLGDTPAQTYGDSFWAPPPVGDQPDLAQYWHPRPDDEQPE